MNTIDREPDHQIRTGHTEPIDFYLKRPDGSIFDASNVTGLTAKGRYVGSAATKFTSTPAAIGDGTAGGIRFTPISTDFDAKGLYEIEVKVDDQDGTLFSELFLIEVEQAFA